MGWRFGAWARAGVAALAVVGILAVALMVRPSDTSGGQGLSPSFADAQAPRKVIQDFELTAYGGGTVKLSDVVHRNKVTVVNFFATWCPPCNGETPDFVRYYSANAAKGVALIGIDIQESSAKVAGFVSRHKVTYPVLLDKQGKVANLYAIYAIPTTFVVDSNGHIRSTFQGLTSATALGAAVTEAMKRGQ